MAATLSATIAAGEYSAEVTVTPNEIFSVQSSHPVNIEAKNLVPDPDEWNSIGTLGNNKQSGAFIATSETIRIYCIGPNAANVEVFA